MANHDEWVSDGEKFAVLGMHVEVEPDASRLHFPCGISSLTKADFVPPEHWREWLGTIRVENVSECTLFIVATQESQTLSILNEEDKLLHRRVNDFFMGLMLTTNLHQPGDPFIAVGSRNSEEIQVRQFQTLKPVTAGVVNHYRPISESGLQQAAKIGSVLGTLTGPWQVANWRLLRCLNVYQMARYETDVLDRIHQFTRCIEGFVAPRIGRTRRDFVSRTSLFIGPYNHDLMRELYNTRSAIEHLHENRYLEQFDRITRIRLSELEAISEWIARSCIVRVLGHPNIIRHFGNSDSIEEFWSLDESERKMIWGPTVDPYAAVADFRFEYVSDRHLGAHE